MNEYKLLTINCGQVKTVYVNASDISQAVWNCGYAIQDIIKIQLIGSADTIDHRTMTSGTD